MSEKVYIAIDLKSFYASVECVYRGLDPMTAHLVVADSSRTEKTICLAVSPALKAFGIPGRPRLFEVVQKVQEINALRREGIPGKDFTGSATDSLSFQQNPTWKLDYIVAPPRMASYLETSASIHQIYLKYFAPEDIHVYSIDEVFIDATGYLNLYRMTPRELTRMVIQDIQTHAGITATAGIGTNLYLCKVAMDIVAKHIPGDKDGVRIAQLDEMSYRRLLWTHRPLTDFWRVGPGSRKKLEKVGLYTMGDIARCSLGAPGTFHSEDLLYKLFGVNAELLIDHAWGCETCTMKDIKAYRPSSHSMSRGQVLHCPYSAPKARLVAREMADLLVLNLVDRQLVTKKITLTIGYDIENLTHSQHHRQYSGPVITDHYGRKLPKPAHGTVNLPQYTASTRAILEAVGKLFDRIVNPDLLIRRIHITANNILPESDLKSPEAVEQLSLFDTPAPGIASEAEQRERRRQKAILAIQKKYGKNALLRGMNLTEGATARDRNQQIGGHRA